MIAAIVVISSIIVGPLGNIFPSTSIGTVALLVQLTDPPNVPVGTQWLNLTYSNLELYVVKEGTSTGWTATGSSGTVNLQSLINISKTIGIIQIPNGSSVDQIRFDIASVQINVNGTVYSVDTPNSALIVPITGGNKLESLSSTLLQLSPTVTETVATAGTAPTFLLVPSATAVIREGSQVSQDQAKVGAETQLTSNDRAELEGARGNVSVVSTTLSVSGNKTSFSITIKNSGNVSVALEAVSLHGGFNVSSTSTSCQTSQSTSTTMGSEDSSTDSNPCASSEVEYPNELVFLANASSTSLVPVNGSDTIQSSNALILQHGQSVTLSFSGTIIITQGDTGNLQTITLFPILGNTYSVNAEFTNNAEAVVQVNATAA